MAELKLAYGPAAELGLKRPLKAAMVLELKTGGKPRAAGMATKPAEDMRSIGYTVPLVVA